jgi:sialic acid synthase SpsE
MPPELPSIVIRGRRVAETMPPYVIAEIGLNHGGDARAALSLVEEAAAAGADAVKLQVVTASALVSPLCPAPAHVASHSMVEFFEAFELDEADYRAVVLRARQLNLAVVATPLSLDAVDLVERLGVDAIKIASGDITFDALVARAAATGKPIVLSTGMSTTADARHALRLARLAGARDVALLHCVSAYPVPRGSENLRAIRTLSAWCDVPVGLSDHGDDAFALPLAVALGASLYERHLMRAGDASAVDAAVSSTPDELASAIAAGRRAWEAMGTGRKACLAAESANLVPSRRSLCAARDLPAGTVLIAADLVALRPATGLSPSSLAALCGQRLIRAAAAGEPLTARHFDAFAFVEGDRVA